MAGEREALRDKCTARLIATDITEHSYHLRCNECGFDSGELQGKPHPGDFEDLAADLPHSPEEPK